MPPHQPRASRPRPTRAGAALLASLTAHAAGLIAAIWISDAIGASARRSDRREPTPITVIPAPAVPDPVEVELIELPRAPAPGTLAAAVAPPSAAIATPPAAVAATTETKIETKIETETETKIETKIETKTEATTAASREPQASAWFKMRGPQLALSAPVGEQPAQAAASDQPGSTLDPLAHLGHVDFVGKRRRGRSRESARVESAGRGTGVIRDGVTNVTVHRDGTVEFHDLPDLDLKFDIHLPTPKQIKADMSRVGRAIDRWAADPYAKAKRAGAIQDVPRHMAATPGACDQWGDTCSREIRRRDWRADRQAERQADLEENARGMVGGGKLDLTAMLMRRLTGDPYAARKRKLLDDSRDVRAEMGARNKAEDLARSAEMMQERLEKLWPTLGDPAAQREALFTLWDECAEGDGPLGEAGQRARAIVIGWIRARLPRDAPGAFTTGDIARLSAARTSSQPFSPYD